MEREVGGGFRIGKQRDFTLKVKSLSHVRLFATPWTVAYQAPLSMGFSRQEYWSGLPFPSPMHERESESEVAQSCLTLRDPMDCSLPGSSIHGVFQARVLESGAIAFTADGDWSHEIKRRLLLGSKAMINLDNILKSRDITLPTKVCIVKAMVFLIVMFGCESWTIKKAEL